MVSRSIETPTLIERFVNLIPVPYRYAALIWAIILPSGPGYSIVAGSFGLFLANLPNAIPNFLLPLYLFLIVRYVRLRVVKAETPISAQLSGGSDEYHRTFGRLTQSTSVILMSVVFGTLLLISYTFGGLLSGSLSLIIPNIIIVYLSSFAFSTYLWEFTTVSLGLHRLGGSSLKLGSFLEDRMMGAKPLGNLALSLTLAYFGGLVILLLLFSTIVPVTLTSEWPWFIFLLLGIVLFFLPLNSVHARMQEQKRRLSREIGARYLLLNQDSSMSTENATRDDLPKGLARIANLQEIDLLDRKIATLPTWPFDIQVVSKFITIVLSVTAVLLSRFITTFFHI